MNLNSKPNDRLNTVSVPTKPKQERLGGFVDKYGRKYMFSSAEEKKIWQDKLYSVEKKKEDQKRSFQEAQKLNIGLNKIEQEINTGSDDSDASIKSMKNYFSILKKENTRLMDEEILSVEDEEKIKKHFNLVEKMIKDYEYESSETYFDLITKKDIKK
jgi:hypothetical protein